MRLKFVKGKQKELIKSFKKNKNLTQRQLADFLEIKEGRLKTYVDENSLIQKEIYDKLDAEKKFFKFILETKKDNWGKVKGGKNSTGSTKEIKSPRDSVELSEFYGIMLGDGNSHRTNFYKDRTNKRGTYMIRIVGDADKDKEYLINHVKPLIERLFLIEVREGKFKQSNAIFLRAHGIQLIDFLEKKGFPPGNKIKNKLKIPLWIKSNPNFLKACLRGLYDTDGSVYKLTNQNSYQFCFTNHNQELLKDVRDSLLKLE